MTPREASRPGTSSVPLADATHPEPASPRGELGRWTVRGAGLGIGLVLVLIVALVAQAAKGVLVLVFFSILLAAAIDPLVSAVRDRIHISSLGAASPLRRARSSSWCAGMTASSACVPTAGVNRAGSSPAGEGRRNPSFATRA